MDNNDYVDSDSPFPINISFDDLTTHYLNSNPDLNINVFLNKLIIDQNEELYTEIVTKFISTFYQKGNWLLIQNAEKIIKNVCSNKGVLKNIFGEFMIDITHLLGMEEEDLEFLIIPFETFNEAFFFGEILEHKNIQSFFWIDGELLKRE